MLSRTVGAQAFMAGIMDYAILEEKNPEAHLRQLRFFAKTIAQGAAKG